MAGLGIDDTIVILCKVSQCIWLPQKAREYDQETPQISDRRPTHGMASKR